MNKHELRSAASTKAMVDAASEIVTEGGFGAITLAAVGERSGYSRGLVTARFGSKEGLLAALIDDIVYAWEERTLRPMLERRNGLEAALGMLPGVWNQVERDDRRLRVLYTLIFESIAGEELLNQRMADFHQTLRDNLTHALTRGIADGSVQPETDTATEAALVLGLIRGVAYQWMLSRDAVDPAKLLRSAYRNTALRVGTPDAAKAAIEEFPDAKA